MIFTKKYTVTTEILSRRGYRDLVDAVGFIDPRSVCVSYSGEEWLLHYRLLDPSSGDYMDIIQVISSAELCTGICKIYSTRQPSSWTIVDAGNGKILLYAKRDILKRIFTFLKNLWGTTNA